MERVTKGEQMAEVFSNYVNGANRGEAKKFAEAVTREHRTLQQLMFGNMIECIKIWAECYEKGWYDPRNEETCRLAKQMWDTVKDEDNRVYLPFI